MEETENDVTISQLANALVEVYKPRVKEAEESLTDLTVKQDLLMGELFKQNRKLEDALKQAHISEMVSNTQKYYTKLSGLIREMNTINERVMKIKKRAVKLQQLKQQEALLKEQAKERQLERERQLIARPAKRN